MAASLKQNQESLQELIKVINQKGLIYTENEDNIATPEQIQDGYIAYGPNGKIVGTAKTYNSGYLDGQRSREVDIESKYIEGLQLGEENGYEVGRRTYVPLTIQSQNTPAIHDATTNGIATYPESLFKYKKISEDYTYDLTEDFEADFEKIGDLGYIHDLTIKNKSPKLTLYCVVPFIGVQKDGTSFKKYNTVILQPNQQTTIRQTFSHPLLNPHFRLGSIEIAFTDKENFPTKDVTVFYRSSLHEDAVYSDTATGTVGAQHSFTTKGADTFSAPAGRYFMGWATSPAGADSKKIAYAAGKTLKTTASLTLWAVWGYEYQVYYSLSPHFNYSTIVKTYQGESTVLNIQLPTLAELGKENISGYDHLGWKDADGLSLEAGAYYTLNATDAAYAAILSIVAEPYPTITYKHTNESNWYGNNGTGPMEAYELRLDGVAEADRGAFSNGPVTIKKPRGTKIEIACTYDIEGDLYKKGAARIYINGTEVANNVSSYPCGNYPYTSSGSLTYPKDGTSSDVAYYTFDLERDTTIDFVSKTNAPALWNKETYWHCRITK